jgi:hypothetical protein
VSDQVFVTAAWQEAEHSPSSRPVHDFEALPRKGGLWFDVYINDGQAVPAGYSVRWRITNTGAWAIGLGKGRGGFEHPSLGSRRWEQLEYPGVHLAEAFIIRDTDNRLVGQSGPFHVMIL